MQTLDAVREMLGRRGMSMYAASVATGHRASYVQSLMRRKGGISAPVLAMLGDVCGYDLALVDRETGEAIRIDPASPGGE